MAVATYADWKTRLESPRERFIGLKANQGLSTVQNKLYSTWVWTPNAGAAPTTAAVPARDIAGALGQQNGGGTALRIAGIKWSSMMAPGASSIQGGGGYFLCDRLSHQGGLSGIVTTAQTTNLPTAALTRYTTGVGVWAALEIYTQIGATATTVTASYTDQGGAAGNITPAVAFGATGFREISKLVMLPNAAGDNGFRSVESVTVLATTGTAGNFGVTLFKPLLFLAPGHQESSLFEPVLGNLGGGYPEILDDACLFWVFVPSSSAMSALAAAQYEISFAED